MEFFAIVGFLIAIFAAFKIFRGTKKNNELTLLLFEDWTRRFYAVNDVQKSHMATALVLQSMHLAESMGAGVSAKNIIGAMNKDKVNSLGVVSEWLQFIDEDLRKDFPSKDFNCLQARLVGAMLVTKMANPVKYRDILRGKV
ncbi:hypothetical protein ACN262_32850 [Burkholderia gladioli]|uniref:hypothetical protein n=1 Tax=Burkholderia gladioli TaxID=28095 RepID=UPI00164206DC|nr:hypothetical protein [Burkholderia gladioli]